MVVNRITTMGQRAGGGARSGGGGAGGGFSQQSFDRATDKLYAAMQSKDKGAIAKAKEQVAAQIAKMSPERIKASAQSASEAAHYASKQMNPKSQYNPTQFKYNIQMSKLYNAAANKLK